MDFVQGKDTLAFADAEMINRITIAKDTFYYQVDIGLVPRIAGAAPVIFVKKRNAANCKQKVAPKFSNLKHFL
jgi:hypothetical protein